MFKEIQTMQITDYQVLVKLPPEDEFRGAFFCEPKATIGLAAIFGKLRSIGSRVTRAMLRSMDRRLLSIPARPNSGFVLASDR
jgi:hypothetical protein